MSNQIISKDKLGAYRLWELDSLDERELVQPEEEPHPAWPTASELEEIQRQAYEEGLAAGQLVGREQGLASGHEEGYKAGFQAGNQAGYAEGHEKSLAELARIEQLMAALDAALEQFDQQLGGEILDLALALAKQVMRSALKFRPESLLAVIREALASLPQPSTHPQLILHPDDAALVRDLMVEELAHVHGRIVEDSHIERGGCHVKTDASEVDATLQVRWSRAIATLGHDDKWLD